MKAYRGYIAGFVVGAIWQTLSVILTGIALVLVFGVKATPGVGAAALAGGLAALTQIVLANHFDSLRLQLTAITTAALLFILLSSGAPFGLSIRYQPFWALSATLVTAYLANLAVAICFADLDLLALNRYKFEVLLIRVFKGLGFVLFTVLVALPFYAMLMASFKHQAALLANPLDYSIDLSRGVASLFSSYIELFETFHFGRYILISILVSVSTVVITLLFSIPGAYAISRLRFPGRAAWARSILLIYMVPAIVLVIPLYSLFSLLGLRDTLAGLLIVYPATTIPVALYMLQGYFRGLPNELEEAGLMDGCTRLAVILRITLPLSLPALVSVALYVFMIAWNEFLFAFMFLDDPSIYTLSRALVSLNSSEVPRQHLMAGSVIVTIPVLVIFLWFERFLVQGLTAGSVKG